MFSGRVLLSICFLIGQDYYMGMPGGGKPGVQAATDVDLARVKRLMESNGELGDLVLGRLKREIQEDDQQGKGINKRETQEDDQQGKGLNKREVQEDDQQGKGMNKREAQIDFNGRNKREAQIDFNGRNKREPKVKCMQANDIVCGLLKLKAKLI